ncbi:MAG TPA: Flp pilus assembly protein CpaB [Chloroflexi bacterium]|nr:Flp pilus assembly protein CpaB [Chloroflexota bacterium]
MSRRGRLLIFLGLILAVMTTGVTYYILQQGAGPAPEVEIRTKPVLVALQPIKERADIPVEAVGTKEWPEDSVPASAFSNPADVMGKAAMVPILEGQIIRSDMLIDKERVVEEGSFAAFAIPEGKVAFAVPIDNIHSVAGAIQAGDFVDVLVTITFQVQRRTGVVTEEGEEIETVQALTTQLALQDVEVLRVGAWNVPPPTEEGEPAPQPQDFLTLLISQQDALVLKYARDDPNFNVDFALRGVEDHTIVSTESVTLQYILTRFNVTTPAPPPTIGP